MSQLLICKSKFDLSEFGQLIDLTNERASSLMSLVVRRYFNSPYEDLWYIPIVEEWVKDVSKNYKNIMFIAERSDSMVFWYSNMYEDLDEISTLPELKKCILKVANTESPELYMHVIMRR